MSFQVADKLKSNLLRTQTAPVITQNHNQFPWIHTVWIVIIQLSWMLSFIVPQCLRC